MSTGSNLRFHRFSSRRETLCSRRAKSRRPSKHARCKRNRLLPHGEWCLSVFEPLAPDAEISEPCHGIEPDVAPDTDFQLSNRLPNSAHYLNTQTSAFTLGASHLCDPKNHFHHPPHFGRDSLLISEQGRLRAALPPLGAAPIVRTDKISASLATHSSLLPCRSTATTHCCQGADQGRQLESQSALSRAQWRRASHGRGRNLVYIPARNVGARPLTSRQTNARGVTRGRPGGNDEMGKRRIGGVDES